jgi:hypothetical protein
VAGGYTSEVKFLVGASVGHDIVQWVREHLSADEHGSGAHGDEYRVTSLYFDTTAGDVFNRRGSYGRSKYRVRRYQDETTVFLERKLRTATRLAKRRTQVDPETLGRLAARAVGNGDPARWFARRLDVRALRPVCQVSYLRMARQADTPAGAARITVDGQVTALANTTCGFVDGDTVALLDGHMILEMKYRAHVPVAFKQLVEQFQLYPRPASKYRLAAHTLGLAGIHA